ncbi:patatin-like phospholipase family protein [Alicyclobacillus sacchari]|uniref:patatin-like phospholipase family protein n=1 Tax=Alicyclobacillus sacchari TaxID=392010 RepID=UPI0024E06F13|nr:patatin-like phospholipase family protein [Alicyclobacillus sacchari]
MADARVGLALGSGGAKGFAHIGVIAALTDSGVPIHAVTGSSMGALVGAVYAMGVGPNMLKALATGLRRSLDRLHGAEDGVDPRGQSARSGLADDAPGHVCRHSDSSRHCRHGLGFS